MSDAEALTPRVFIIRHGMYMFSTLPNKPGKIPSLTLHTGETEWAKNGRHTGRTDIELTPTGIRQVRSTAVQLVGPDLPLDSARLAKVFVSPRRRALQTFEALFEGPPEYVPREEIVEITEDIAEWDYGDYEGLTPQQTMALRRERGLDQEAEWNVWRDGCEGGESPEQVAERLDKLIREIREIQKPFMRGEKPADVLLVSSEFLLCPITSRTCLWVLNELTRAFRAVKLGGTWAHSASLGQEVAQLSRRLSVVDDHVAWCGWNFDVSAMLLLVKKIGGLRGEDILNTLGLTPVFQRYHWQRGSFPSATVTLTKLDVQLQEPQYRRTSAPYWNGVAPGG